jgi:hypothetical protein
MLKITKAKMDVGWGAKWVVEHLLSKLEALSSSTSTTKE